jgi:hypothetical protein
MSFSFFVSSIFLFFISVCLLSLLISYYEKIMPDSAASASAIATYRNHCCIFGIFAAGGLEEAGRRNIIFKRKFKPGENLFKKGPGARTGGPSTFLICFLVKRNS